MISKYIFRIASSVLFLGLISLSFIGSSCNDILEALGGSGDVVGTWNLTEQGGAQYDVCAQEQVTFTTTQATLSCPTITTPVTRGYTISNDILSYDTGISYTYSVTTESGIQTLTMTGRNISRILKYSKAHADNKETTTPQSTGEKNNILNSSEAAE